MKTVVLLCITFTLLVICLADAHELVLLPSGKDDLLIRFGHPGEYEPADLPRLVKLDWHDLAAADFDAVDPQCAG